MLLLTLIFFNFLFITNIYSNDICIQKIGNTGINSTVSCNPGYTLLSCGVNGTNPTKISGTIINNNNCYIKSLDTISTLTAIAQCCNITSYLIKNCTTTANSECKPSETLLDCNYLPGTQSMNNIQINGFCPTNSDDKTCNKDSNIITNCYAEPVDLSIVTPKVQCCQTPNNFKCKTISNTNTGIANVKCNENNKEILTSCSAFSTIQSQIKAYYIENDTCTVIANSSTVNIKAIGLCCGEIIPTQNEPHKNQTQIIIVIGIIFGIIAIFITGFFVKTCRDAKGAIDEPNSNIDDYDSERKVIESPSEYDGVYSSKINDKLRENNTTKGENITKVDEFTPNGNNNNDTDGNELPTTTAGAMDMDKTPDGLTSMMGMGYDDGDGSQLS